MNDEAAAHHVGIIDQMTLGHQWLMDHFGVVPKIGWQIDPFGHSSWYAVMCAQMGFDALFFERIDYQDFNIRLEVPKHLLHSFVMPL